VPLSAPSTTLRASGPHLAHDLSHALRAGARRGRGGGRRRLTALGVGVVKSAGRESAVPLSWKVPCQLQCKTRPPEISSSTPESLACHRHDVDGDGRDQPGSARRESTQEMCASRGYSRGVLVRGSAGEQSGRAAPPRALASWASSRWRRPAAPPAAYSRVPDSTRGGTVGYSTNA
jgi:hypothetical protein